MYLIHFFNQQGRYQVPIYREDFQSALTISFAYKSLVPGIRVTKSDEVVLETQSGQIIWPDLDAETLANIATVVPEVQSIPVIHLLPTYVEASDRAYRAAPEEQEWAFTELRDVEVSLLGNAASEGLNLNEYGEYRHAEVIITEISERQ